MSKSKPIKKGELFALGTKHRDSPANNNNTGNGNELITTQTSNIATTTTTANTAQIPRSISEQVNQSSILTQPPTSASLTTSITQPINTIITTTTSATKSQQLQRPTNIPNLVEPKSIRDELEKALDKDNTTTDKLNKLVISIINLIKQNINKQIDLNYLLALSYALQKRPQHFLKQTNIIEMLVNLLFSTKSEILSVTTPTTQKMKSQITSCALIQQFICNTLNKLFENEHVWPDIFVKAYVDDALADRVWIDSDLCQEFVQNILPVFHTKPIPFSFENTNDDLLNQNNSNSSSSSNQQQQQQNIQMKIESSLASANRTFSSDVETLIIDTIKDQMSKRSMVESKNLIKLLQITCGIFEIRSLALSKMEGWLSNPKLSTNALDLLLSVCVNCCDPNNLFDRDLIVQMLKLKPKIKQQQHYLDCIRELVKINKENFEFVLQTASFNEITQPRNQHNNNMTIIQVAFSVNGRLASKLFAQIIQRVLLNREDNLRILRSILRDTIRNSRQEFDLNRFTFELLEDIRKTYTDFMLTELVIRERYVSSICDLITVCIFVGITNTVKETHNKQRYNETISAANKEQLIKYYNLSSNIQRETVSWLQAIVRNYDINAKERISCLFKVLFMSDKPEIYYSIDDWPPAHDRQTIFRVVSEIPVLYDTLVQVLLIADTLPQGMPVFMLEVEERLLKTATIVQFKDSTNQWYLQIDDINAYLDVLFKITEYKYPSQYDQLLPRTFKPPKLVVTTLYWKAWQILLIITALDPKGFGKFAWENYPMLKMLMEMIMTEDYNYPPQTSLSPEMSVEKYRAIEAEFILNEKKEILELENYFVSTHGGRVITVISEQNSQLIGQVMRFDPNGPARRPPNEVLQNIRKLNTDYKLGQLLCKCRSPDYLLFLIQRQNSSVSLTWLAGLIESNNECLDIMPIQCICEFVWNVFSGIDEVQFKKPINVDQLLNRIQSILQNKTVNDATIQQINDAFSYFMNKLCSDKLSVREGSLKILSKIFTKNDKEVNLKAIFNEIKSLNTFNVGYKSVLMKYLNQALMIETNLSNIYEYICFICDQILIDLIEIGEQQMKQEQIDYINSIALNLLNFLFKRPHLTNKLFERDDREQLFERLIQLCGKLIKINEIDSSNEIRLNTLKTIKYTNDSQTNCYLLVKLTSKTSENYVYMHEKLFNLIVYLLVKCSYLHESPQSFYTTLLNTFFPIENESKMLFLNCDHLSNALNDKTKREILCCNDACVHQLCQCFISELGCSQIIGYFKSVYGLSKHAIELMFGCLDAKLSNYNELVLICAEVDTTIDNLVQILSVLAEDLSENRRKTSRILAIVADNYKKKEMYTLKPFYLSNEINNNGTETMEFELDEDIDKQNAYCANILDKIKKQTAKLVSKNTKSIEKMQIDDTESNNNDAESMSGIEYNESGLIENLYKLIKNTKIKNLESELIKYLCKYTSTTSSRVELITKFLYKYENTLNLNLIETLINLFVYINPQIVVVNNNNNNDCIGENLLFSNYNQTTKNTSNNKLQSFLLALFIRQANWNLIYSCVNKFLSVSIVTMSSRSKSSLNINSSIVLDFLWSLIHMPEFWRGIERISTQKFDGVYTIIDLSKEQLANLIEYIYMELIENKASDDINQLKLLFKKRMLLVKHFLLDDKNKEKLEYLVDHIQNLSTAGDADKIRNLILFQLYLNEPDIIFSINNANKKFTNLYFDIDAPTKYDTKTHHFLSCFNEIDPSRKAEVIAFNKKQESLMIDANFVCLKLASTHPLIFIRYIPMMEGLLQGRVVHTFDEFKRRKLDKLFHYIVDLLNIIVPYLFKNEYLTHFEMIISHYFDVFKSYSIDSYELGSLIVKFMDLLEKFINYDADKAIKMLAKYSQLISYLQKSYSDILSLKYINSIISSSLMNLKHSDEIDDSLTISQNIYVPKATSRLWNSKELEPFINKLLNRDNIEGVISVLQELDTISQRQPAMLAHFVHHLHDFLVDSNDLIRDLTFSLLMRYLRQNPKDSFLFYDTYCRCLNSQNSKIFKSALKILPDFTLLCSEKANLILKYALSAGIYHSIDITKSISDAMRILNLEKYVY